MNYHLPIQKGINSDIVERVYAGVFRRAYEEDGFTVLSFEEEMDTRRLRKYMVELKRGLSEKCKEALQAELDYYWLTRFDQQKTTKYHRDNAPKDSYLMLGYEPTTVESKLLFADYHRLITERNIPVDKYYELYNPMFKEGAQRLEPYSQEVEGFEKEAYQIVMINNSDLNSDKTLGVLHKVEIIDPDLSQVRVVNSMMLYLKPLNESRNKSKEEEQQFIETDEINK